MSRKRSAPTARKHPPKTDGRPSQSFDIRHIETDDALTDRIRSTTPSCEEFVHPIADALKPWNCPEVDVLARIGEAIDRVRKDRTGQWGYIDIGTRQENKKYAEMLLDLLNTLIKQLAAAPPGFVASLETQEVDACVASFQQEEEKNRYDGAVDRFFSCLDDYQYKPRRELTELSDKLARLAEQCKRSILDPAGPHPRSRADKIRTAFTALFLMLDTSKEPPAAGNRNTPFCLIASLLFEAATGEHEPNLERACKYTLRTARVSGFIELFSKR
jgi:hypothetical protein